DRSFLLLAEDVRRSRNVTGVQTCALPIFAGVQSLSGSHRVIRTMIKTKPNLQWMVERAFRAELINEMAKRVAQIGMIQETVLRTLPDSADGSAEAGRADTA